MAASEGDGTPRKPATRDEEEEYGATPASSTAGVDDYSPVTRRDLARTRRAIGTSLKSMHEEFTQLLMSTQQECSTRIATLEALIIKDREVTQELIKLESQKREALEKQLTGRSEAPPQGPANSAASRR